GTVIYATDRETREALQQLPTH
ncbi:MAG: hypothetical protein QOK02_5820, partial [Mycobacterium sp.]|nr:hypothetical protein [Mycobacterium sp.]